MSGHSRLLGERSLLQTTYIYCVFPTQAGTCVLLSYMSSGMSRLLPLSSMYGSIKADACQSANLQVLKFKSDFRAVVLDCVLERKKTCLFKYQIHN